VHVAPIANILTPTRQKNRVVVDIPEQHSPVGKIAFRYAVFRVRMVCLGLDGHGTGAHWDPRHVDDAFLTSMLRRCCQPNPIFGDGRARLQPVADVAAAIAINSVPERQTVSCLRTGGHPPVHSYERLLRTIGIAGLRPVLMHTVAL
jgi:hypothetical protein